MSLSNTTENELALLIFNKTLPAWLGALSSTGNTDFYLSLHTADPGEAGNQTTNECAYGSYARIPVVRTSSGWTVSGNQAVNAALAQFAEASSGSETITHVAIGTASSGAGQIVVSGALNASRAVSTGIQPQFGASQLTVTFD